MAEGLDGLERRVEGRGVQGDGSGWRRGGCDGGIVADDVGHGFLGQSVDFGEQGIDVLLVLGHIQNAREPRTACR